MPWQWHAMAVHPDWSIIVDGPGYVIQPHAAMPLLFSWSPISEHCDSVGVIGDVQGIGEGEEEK